VHASFVLIKTDGSQSELALKKARVVIGRGEDCQVRLNSASVSRQHCELQVDDARVVVKDLGSSNGTFVNKRRVAHAELSAGDVVSIGAFTFVCRLNGQPVQINSGEATRKGQVPVPGQALKTPQGKAKDPLLDDGPAKDSSSEWDFDFLDEKNDKAPKL
jgi:pSer/pThr/pTyr-binding forkhead associated (FHA) protein